jgi:hypothetical protein
MAAESHRRTNSEELTPRTSSSAASLRIFVFHDIFKVQIRRQQGSGWSLMNSRDPEIHELRKVDLATPKLREASPQEGTQVDGKTHSGDASTSTTPPAGDLANPTIYTTRETRFPRPPAAGAAAGG